VEVGGLIHHKLGNKMARFFSATAGLLEHLVRYSEQGEKKVILFFFQSESS